MANLYDEGVTNYNEGEQDYDYDEKTNENCDGPHYKSSKYQLFTGRMLFSFIFLFITSFIYYQHSLSISSHNHREIVTSKIEEKSIHELKEYAHDLSSLMNEITILNNTMNTNILNQQQNIIKKITKLKHEKQSVLQSKYIKLQTFIENITNALKSMNELLDNTDIDQQQRIHKIISLRNSILMHKLPISIDNFLNDLSFVLNANNELSFVLKVINEEKSESMHKKIRQMVIELNESFQSKNKLIDKKAYTFTKEINEKAAESYLYWLFGVFLIIMIMLFFVCILVNAIYEYYWQDTLRSHLKQENVLLHAEIDRLKQQQSVQEPPLIIHDKNKKCKKLKKLKKSKKFKYKYDFDKNGIIYYLGTKYCSSKNWMNPVAMNIINIKTSGWMYGTAQDIISRNIIGHCYCQRYENAFVEIHFNENIKIKPNKYTLRHPNSEFNYLRSWTFLGSVDRINWDILRIHRNDRIINTRSKSHSWKIKNCNKYYQVFKIEMTDKSAGDAFGKTWYFGLNGFEMYGELLNV